MDATALLLSRIQFGFTISFHIIFPAFTIGLAAWLTVLEALHLRTGKQVYRVLFDFWLKIFGIAFGLGVVSGVVMGFQFGTNWSELSKMSGPIQGPLLSYETFTAFMLEASFFGILVFGRNRVRPGFYLFSTAMVALGTTLSAFWIMINNSWMQVPVGYVLQNGIFVPDDWLKIIFNQVAMVRFVHMLLAAYLSSAFCVAATGAWYMLRNIYHAEARVMLRMGLFLAAVLLPVQLVFGHLVGDYVHQHQPAKFAAIEARWHDEQPASEVIIAIPDEATEFNRYELKIPVLGSIIGSMSTDVEGSWTDVLSAAGPAAGPHPVHDLPGHGRLRPDHAWAGMARLLADHQASDREKPLAASLHLPEFSAAVHRNAGGLVHRRGRPPAVGRLWRAAYRQGHDAVPDGARGGDLADPVRRGLRLHLLVRHLLHLPAAARRPRRRWPRSRPTPCPTGRCRWPTRNPSHIVISFRRENRHGHVLGRIAGDQHPDLSPARRLRSRRRHPVPAAEQRVAAASDVGRDRAVLGRQRDLAGGNRRDPVGCLSGGVRHSAFGFLYSCHLHAAGLDPARGRLRIPQQVAAVALDLESELWRRFAGREFHAGRHGWRPSCKGCRW